VLDDPRQLEAVPGFTGWLVSSSPPPNEPGVDFLGVAPLWCRFSRALDKAERARVFDCLERYVESRTTYVVKIRLGVPSESLAAERRAALHRAIGGDRRDTLSFFCDDALIDFGRDRPAAESARARLAVAGFDARVARRVDDRLTREVGGWEHARLLQSDSVEDRMRPGVLSARGFLGKTERLDAVMARDAKTLASLGVAPGLVARRIREVVGEALDRWSPGDGGVYDVDRFRVSFTQYRGYQECPWGCEDEPRWASIDFEIENVHSGAKLEGPGLIAHLVEEHSFFEGRESPYRVEPRLAVEVLELRKQSMFDRVLATIDAWLAK
jgi:hypothetical protein